MPSPLDSTLSRRTALRGFGALGLTAAGLLASTQAHASGDLVVVDQIGTGPWDTENCGPTSTVIAMVAAGREVRHYVSGEKGTTVGGNRRAVIEMRARCGLSPWGEPEKKTVDYTGAYLGDLEDGLRDAGARATRARFEEGLEAAARGKVVILHVHHGRLLGEEEADYGPGRGREREPARLRSGPRPGDRHHHLLPRPAAPRTPGPRHGRQLTSRPGRPLAILAG